MVNFRNRFILQVFATFIILIVLISIMVYLGIQIKESASTIYSTRQDLRDKTHNISELSQLRLAAKEAEPFLEKLEAAIPSKDELFSFADDLKEIARMNDLGLNFKFVGEAIISGGLGSQKFEANAQGDYRDITFFIRELERSGYITNVLDVNILKQGSLFNALLIGEVYFNAQA
ncbi:MAG TPA: type 4a pilus biogenesis protein PilO [Candidatus Paceibacterota bacterium]